MHALDYLLKPFDRDRFRQALTRANQQLERPRGGDMEKRLAAIVNDLRPAKAKTDRFVVKSGGRIFFVRTAEIDWIEAAGNYVKLHVGNDSHLIRETMNAVEGKLSPETFVRIHRCHIVNIEQVRELQPWFNGEYVVFLKNGTRLTLSRGYRERLQDRVGRIDLGLLEGLRASDSRDIWASLRARASGFAAFSGLRRARSRRLLVAQLARHHPDVRTSDLRPRNPVR